jgi:hypothetical protein
VYDGVTKLVLTTDYTVDFPNGMVTLVSTPNGTVTADFTTNESIPAEIKEACILLTCHLIGQAGQNPIGADSLSIQTFNISFGKDSKVEERAKKLLEPYVDRVMTLVGI